MQAIYSFGINEKKYTIWEVDKIEGRNTYIGETRYDDGIILIEKGSKEQMVTTLSHELAHVWLYENGHKYQVGGCFTYEDVCEMIAYACESVEKITHGYIKAKGW